jgi:hypothetical protein
MMAYTFVRIGVVAGLTRQDYFQVGKRSVIQFREKTGKEKTYLSITNWRNTSAAISASRQAL